MASSRPVSMVISSDNYDETNTNGTRNSLHKKESSVIRSSNQQQLPLNTIAIEHSSSSSIDSTGAKNAILNNKTSSSLPPMNLSVTVSSTTTDSELDSEHEEQYTDDNNSLESTNLPIQTQQQQQSQKSSRRESGREKSDGNTSEQSSRRMKHFRKLFKSEIADEDMPELIDSYVCAYQGDILLQGKMYITDRYLCFHSRIISYVTKHVYRWEQIENVTKERVAFIFPTAVGIQLKPSGKKIIYASFLQRDQAFDKILLISSRFNSETSSIQDDDETSLPLSGTLKAINSNHSNNMKNRQSKHNNHYELPDESEQDNVLQMCLTSDRTRNNNHNNSSSGSSKRRPQSISSKSSDDKQQLQTKKLLSSDKKTISFRNTTIDQNLSNAGNENLSPNTQTNRTSRQSKTQQNQTAPVLSTDSVVYRQSLNTSSRTRQNQSRDRTSSPVARTLSNIPQSNSSSNLTTANDFSVIDSNNIGFIRRYSRMIIFSIISIIKLIIEYFLLLFNQFKTYPIKTSFVLLIFVTILIFHSFYLIQLAYRIENRLQSLHHLWPPSSMKNSLPTLKEF